MRMPTVPYLGKDNFCLLRAGLVSKQTPAVWLVIAFVVSCWQNSAVKFSGQMLSTVPFK